jgi:hypothetical protein
VTRLSNAEVETEWSYTSAPTACLTTLHFTLTWHNFHALKLQYELLPRASASYRQLNHLPALRHVTFTCSHRVPLDFAGSTNLMNVLLRSVPAFPTCGVVIGGVHLIWFLSWSTPTVLVSLLHSHADCDVRVWMLFTSSSTVEWSHNCQVVYSGLRYDINLSRNNSVSVF